MTNNFSKTNKFSNLIKNVINNTHSKRENTFLQKNNSLSLSKKTAAIKNSESNESNMHNFYMRNTESETSIKYQSLKSLSSNIQESSIQNLREKISHQREKREQDLPDLILKEQKKRSFSSLNDQRDFGRDTGQESSFSERSSFFDQLSTELNDRIEIKSLENNLVTELTNLKNSLLKKAKRQFTLDESVDYDLDSRISINRRENEMNLTDLSRQISSGLNQNRQTIQKLHNTIDSREERSSEPVRSPKIRQYSTKIDTNIENLITNLRTSINEDTIIDVIIFIFLIERI